MDLRRLSPLVSSFCLLFPQLRTTYHKYKRSLLRAHRMKMQLRFLKNCRDEKVIPSSCLPRRLRNFDNQAFSELDDILLTTYIKKLSGEVRTAFQKSNCARTLLRNCVSNEWC